MLLKKPRISTAASGLLFLLTYFVGVSALAQTPKYVLQWSLESKGQSVEEGIDQETLSRSSQIFDTRLKARSKYYFTENLHFDFQPVVKFQSGRNQAIDGTNDPSNGFFLKQAAFRWAPTSQLMVSVGAMSQESLHTSLVADDIPFPALRGGGRINSGNWEFATIGELSVPSSNTLGTNTNEVEATPTKEAFQLQANWKSSSYFSKNKIGYYKYKNLPSDIAAQSEPLGNSARETAADTYAFEYDFQGLEFQSETEIPLQGPFDLWLKIEGAKNAMAPETLNTGYVFGGGVIWHASSRHRFGLDIYRFRIESDVAPAVFSNRASFRTNRNGYEVQANWYLKKEKLKITTAYKEADVIFVTGTQEKAKLIEIRLETDYANL